MNGKKARALRRMSIGSKRPATALDADIVARDLERKQRIQLLGPKPVKFRVNKQCKGHGPTWPKTVDQKKQSRPVIELQPVRNLKLRMLLSNPADESGHRYLTDRQIGILRGAPYLPKHLISHINETIWRSHVQSTASTEAS